MNLGPEYPEVLSDLATVLRELLVAAGGLSEPKAQEIAREAAERIRQHFGGQLIYIPLGLRHEVMKRWQEIWSKYTGDNVPSLAKEYRCSEVHINRIVRHMREVESRARHAELFVEPAKPQP